MLLLDEICRLAINENRHLLLPPSLLVEAVSPNPKQNLHLGIDLIPSWLLCHLSPSTIISLFCWILNFLFFKPGIAKTFLLESSKTSLIFVAIVQSLSPVRLFVTPWTAALQAFWSFTIYCSVLKLMCTESKMPSVSSSVMLFSCIQSFPASGCFPLSLKKFILQLHIILF